MASGRQWWRTQLNWPSSASTASQNKASVVNEAGQVPEVDAAVEASSGKDSAVGGEGKGATPACLNRVPRILSVARSQNVTNPLKWATARRYHRG